MSSCFSVRAPTKYILKTSKTIVVICKFQNILLQLSLQNTFVKKDNYRFLLLILSSETTGVMLCSVCTLNIIALYFTILHMFVCVSLRCLPSVQFNICNRYVYYRLWVLIYTAKGLNTLFLHNTNKFTEN